MKKWYQSIGTLLIVLAALETGCLSLFAHSPVAHAGSAGQQILFTNQHTSCPQGILQTVQISGTNQRNAPATWTGLSTDGSTIWTQNYWWIGSVTITYQVNGSSYTTRGFIPQQSDQNQPDQDTSYVTCLGTRQWATAAVVAEDGYSWGCVVLDSNLSGHYTVTKYFSGYQYIDGNGVVSTASIVGSSTIGIVDIVQETDVPTCG